MTVSEILRTITAYDVLKAINNYVHNVTSRKGRPNDRFVSYENKDYPAKELLKQAMPSLKNTSNFSNNSYTSDMAQKRLEELGFNVVIKKNTKAMYKYYIKKVSNQDVEKTTVINAEAEHSFFGINIPERDDSATISIMYLSDGVFDKDVKLIKKQDIRIFIDRSRFVEGDILLFEKIQNNEFLLSIITNYDKKYSILNSSLKNNYLLTDDLPVDSYTGNIVNDVFTEYKMEQPLNQILFGPPGTGKTYSTITKALNIIGLLEEKDNYTNEEYEVAQKLFRNELGKRIEFVTMHQSFSYEDFVQGLKPNKSEDGIGLNFDFKNGVFKEICKRADLLKRENRIVSIDDRVDFDVVYNYTFKSLFDDNEPIELSRGGTKFLIIDFSEKTLWFETSNGTSHPRYTIAKKTLKKIYEAQNNNLINSGNKGYFDATLDLLLKNEKYIKEKKGGAIPQNINHVIILDEINRANISRVFGELIALVEKDKRDGKLTVTLPSGDPFYVPSNLYVIGTMNTADKSIALVDIALRRRFQFIPLYPNSELLRSVLAENNLDQNEIKKRVYLMTNLNKIIRAKKSVDFEIGHSYFMAKDSLINILNHQILPLMNEYFMYDLRKVKEIIEQSQKDREGKSIPKLGIQLNQTLWIERGLLEVENITIPTQEALEGNLVDIVSNENDN